MQQCNSAQLPVDPKNLLCKNIGSPSVNPHNYRSLVGSLLYATNTCPDICFDVSSLSRYMDNPQQNHLQAAKHVLRYLQGTKHYGLLFPKNNTNILNRFVDADWGRDLDTWRSTSGILHKIGNSSIAWTSKLQPTVSLSTTEAEYMVLSEAAKDIVYLRRLFIELGKPTDKPTTISSDNQSCLKLVSNPVLHNRTKHISIQDHFIREKVASQDISIKYIPAQHQ